MENFEQIDGIKEEIISGSDNPEILKSGLYDEELRIAALCILDSESKILYSMSP